MGFHKNISFDNFPKQSDWIGKTVDVCFNYDTSKIIEGTIVRYDCEEPGLTIIRLADGRYILSIECQYHFRRNWSIGAYPIKKTLKQWETFKGLRIIDYDGFDRTDEKLMERFFTEDEFDKLSPMCTQYIDVSKYIDKEKDGRTCLKKEE